MCMAQSILTRSICTEEWRGFKACIQINIESWRTESVRIRLFLFLGELKTFQNQKPPATIGVEMRAVERLWPVSCEAVACDAEPMLHPLLSVSRTSLSLAQCRSTLHHLNLPEAGLCLVHQYLLQTSQQVEEFLSEKPAWEEQHLQASPPLLGVRLHYKRTTCEHKHQLLCRSYFLSNSR